MFLDLVDRDVGREEHLSPPDYASEAALVGKVAQCLAAVVDGFDRFTSGGGIVFCDTLKYSFQVVGSKRSPSDFHQASALEETIEALSHLLVREIFAALQGFLAQLNSFHKASFLCEIAADRFLRKRIRVATSMAG